MRVLVLTNFYPPHHIGGYEMRCREMVDGLRRRGHEVRVLTGRYDSGAASLPEPHVSRALHLSWGPPYPPEDLPGLLAAEAADRRELAELLAAFGPEVIDIWGMEFASQSLVAALLASPAPVHLMLEDNWLLDAWSRDPLCNVAAVCGRLNVSMPVSIRRLCCLAGSWPAVADRPVCFVARSLAEYYAGKGLVCSNARVRPGGIDVSPLTHLLPAPPPPPFVVLNAGQLTPSRGQADLVTAAGQAAADPRCPLPIVVRIVGGGSEAHVDDLRQLAATVTSHKCRFEFAGPQPPDRMAGFYAGAHLFVFTSRRPFEGLPRVMAEAMAAGLPMVATNTGGQRDILADGRWGPLLPPGEPQKLKESILDAMLHYPAWRQRAAQARVDALQRFDLDSCIDAHAADLEEKKGSEAFCQDGPEGASHKRLLTPFSRSDVVAFACPLGNAATQAFAVLDVVAEPDYAWQLGVVLKRTGRLAEAERLLGRLHELHGHEPVHVRRASFHLAELAMLAGRWPEAAELLAICLAVAPDHRKAVFNLDYAHRRVLPDHLASLKAT